MMIRRLIAEGVLKRHFFLFFDSMRREESSQRQCSMANRSVFFRTHAYSTVKDVIQHTLFTIWLEKKDPEEGIFLSQQLG